MRLIITGLVAFLLLSVPVNALAWGPIGHRVTGAIAEPLLSAKARHAVQAILGTETLAEASTWPDDMRANPDDFWQHVSRPWHYVTVPPGHSYGDAGAPPEGDAVTALRAFAATLRDPNASLEQRRLALRFTVHIIGDLHQPLHAGNGTDDGGGRVAVTWFGQASNLHSVWDSGLIDRRQLSYSELTAFLARRMTPSLRREWSNPDPRVWISESVAIRDRLYPASPDLGGDYAYQWRETVDTRLMQAGVRIAAYVNNLFK